MLYGSGEYDVRRAVESYPGPRVRPEAVQIADRHRGADMKTCFDMPRPVMFGRQCQSMNVTQTCGPMKHMGVRSPIPVDPTYNGGKYSNRSFRPVPRVKPEAEDIAERAKGSMSVVLGKYGKSDPYDDYLQSRGNENINPREGPMKKAGIRGPITVDPIYNKGQYTGRSPKPVSRVKPEASEFAEKNKGTVGNLLKNPDVRLFKQAKPKTDPVDHGQENLRRMREIKRQSREREREKERNKPTPVKALWKSSRYETIESKVKTTVELTPRAPRGPAARPGSAPSSLNRPSSAPPGSRRNYDRDVQTQTPLTPGRQAERRAEDIIARNARLAKTYKPQRSRSQMQVDRSQKNYEDGLERYSMNVKGTTPAYLQQRQREWARQEQERLRNIPDPTVPEGHSVLPEKDRRETLQVLRKSQIELLQQYRLLPVRSADSIGIRHRKTELERRVAEVDEAIRVFERPRVFVKMDE